MKIKFNIYLVLLVSILFSCESKDKRAEPYFQQNIIINTDKIEIDLIDKEKFVNEIELDNFKISNNFKSVPYFIKSYLDSLYGKFEIANPNEEYESTDVQMGKLEHSKKYDSITHDSIIVSFKQVALPDRQLQLFGWNSNIAFLVYSKGGYNSSNLVLLFEYNSYFITKVFKTYSTQRIETKENIINLLKSKKVTSFSTEIKE